MKRERGLCADCRAAIREGPGGSAKIPQDATHMCKYVYGNESLSIDAEKRGLWHGGGVAIRNGRWVLFWPHIPDGVRHLHPHKYFVSKHVEFVIFASLLICQSAS